MDPEEPAPADEVPDDEKEWDGDSDSESIGEKIEDRLEEVWERYVDEEAVEQWM